MKALLVIPSYRDAGRLALFLPELCDALQAVPDLKVRVVDDGSGAVIAEETAQLVRKLAQQHPILLEPLLLDPNRGKGGAIYAGWDAAAPEVEWLGFADADGATSAHEVKRLVCAAMDPASAAMTALTLTLMRICVDPRTSDWPNTLPAFGSMNCGSKAR